MKMRLHRIAVVILALEALLAAANQAHAQTGVALDQFDPAPAGDRFFGVQSPDARGSAQLRAVLLLDYAHNPLVLRNPANGSAIGSTVRHQFWAHLAPSFSLANRAMFSFDVPLALAQSGDNPAGDGLSAASPSSAQFGDVRVGARMRIVGPPRDGLQLGLGMHLWLPTGARDAYVSDGTVRGMPFAVLGASEDRLAWSVQLGMLLRKGQMLADTWVGNAITFGGGLGFLIDGQRTLMVGPELYGQLLTAQGAKFLGAGSTHAELLLAGHWRVVAKDWVVGLGAGPGLGHGGGTPDVRIVANLVWSPRPEPFTD